ncbi:unnamed protein product [Brachionus calyciflorus]|uniref:Uncharacterized protein n=1 Tax=Brachionus calyciflorus TaxID=104777 RepID=A0A814A885_9BILA|nr:unnamed protein product [Brachionus calyciflorus]
MGKARIHENLEKSRSIAPKRKLEEKENEKDTTTKQITEPITEIKKETNKKQAVTVAEKITQQEQTSIDDEMAIDEKTNGERQNREENEHNPVKNQENLETKTSNNSKQNDLEETLKQRRKYFEGVKNDDHLTH